MMDVMAIAPPLKQAAVSPSEALEAATIHPEPHHMALNLNRFFTGRQPRSNKLRMAWLIAITSTALSFAGSPPTFTDVAGSAGLRFRHTFGAKKLQNIVMTTGSGAAFLDYDRDGFLDVFLVNGVPLDARGRIQEDATSRHGLFHNLGDGSFENVTRAAGLDQPSYGQGVAVADFDGDGWVDIYVTNYGPNQLYRNRGDSTFEDVTTRSGTGNPTWSSGAVFFDYDGDLDLDLFVAGYVKYQPGTEEPHSSALSKRTGFRAFPGPRDYFPEDDVLYRNEGEGRFSNVSREAGVLTGGKGLTVVSGDFDNDGDQDLFVANDATPNFLYRNDAGHLVDFALEAGVAFDPDGVETAAMGIDVVDIDADGYQDLYVTNMVFEFNNFYLNQGDLLFEDVTKQLKLDEDNYRHVGWATRFADFDLDGHLDCFVANGHVVDFVEGFSQSITYPQQNMLFMGDGKGDYRNLANEAGKPFTRKRVSRGAVFGDYDNDGDIDIVVNNSGGRVGLLRNDLAPATGWLKVQLAGRPPNTQGIGARVTVLAGKRSRHYEVRSAGSYLSANDPTLHVGLGPGVEKGRILVRWPSGQETEVPFEADRRVIIEEPESTTAAEESPGNDDEPADS